MLGLKLISVSKRGFRSASGFWSPASLFAGSSAAMVFKNKVGIRVFVFYEEIIQRLHFEKYIPAFPQVSFTFIFDIPMLNMFSSPSPTHIDVVYSCLSHILWHPATAFYSWSVKAASQHGGPVELQSWKWGHLIINNTFFHHKYSKID